MSPSTGLFQPLPDLPNVWVATKGNLRCVAFALADSGLCVVSPVQGLAKAAASELAAQGKVLYLFAPNHYHNKGIAQWSEQFPAAKLCAPTNAKVRLQEQTGLRFTNLTALTKRLPKGLTLLEPIGLKTGEQWLRWRHKGNCTWLVVDAFAGPKMTATKTQAAKPELLKTFPSYGVSDSTTYVNWLTKQIQTDQPSQLIPCHGCVVKSDALPKHLLSLSTKL